MLSTLKLELTKNSINLRVYCQYAYQAIFATHLFRRIKSTPQFIPDLTVYCAPSVSANQETDGTNSETFIILNIEEKILLSVEQSTLVK